MKVNYVCTRNDCRNLYGLLDSIEYAQNTDKIPLPVNSQFRYARNYNARHLGKAVNEALDLLKIPEPHFTVYKEYQKQLQELQKEFDPGKDENGVLLKMSDENIAKMGKKLEEIQSQESVKKAIEEVNKKKVEYDELMEQEVTVKLEVFRRSTLPDFSNNTVNDAFMFHFQQRKLLIDDLENKEEIKTVKAKKFIPANIKSTEAFGNPGISQS